MKLNKTLLMLVALLAGAIGFTGCQNKFAVKDQSVAAQIMQQTSNPILVSKAVFIDAVGVYNHSLKLWEPYNDIVKKTDPELYDKVKGMFKEAHNTLDQWKELAELGKLGEMQGTTFRDLRRAIITIIAEREAKNNG
jgi:hypothetical protein